MLQFLIQLALAVSVLGFDIDAQNVAVYWGQNSAGSQTRLQDYCTDDVDIVLLSFLYSFPSNLQVNFANMCGDTFSDGLHKCDQIGEDIQYCQDQGKVILLSMGGASGAYGFTSDDQATEFAETLWNKFAGGSDTERPFGDAIVDGFDFDLENNDKTGTAALGNALRTWYATDTSKTYYLSAAPQCPYPDASVGDLLEQVPIDFAFIQFYNNYCNLGSQFNWDTWQDYATNTSPNKDIKLFLGQPGGQTGAGSGYNSASVVGTYVDEIKSTANFGGIMLWDASQAVSNVDNGVTYLHEMKELLNSGDSKEVTTPTTSSTTTSSTKATTSSTSITSTKATTSSTSTTSTKATTSSTSTTSTTPVKTSSTSTTSTIPVKTTSTTSTPTTTSISSTSTTTTTGLSMTTITPTTSTSTSSTNTNTATSTSPTTTLTTELVSAEATSTSTVSVEETTDNATTETLVTTVHNSIETTSTVTISPTVKTLTHMNPTTVTTKRIVGTTTIVAVKYMEPPNF